MKKCIYLPLICLLLATSLFAQDSTNVRTRSGTPKIVTRMMTLQIGYANMTNSVLRQFYAAIGDELDQHYMTFGLASTTEYRRCIMGLTLQGGMTQTFTIRNYNASTSNYQVSSSFGNALLQFGYAIVNTNKIKFYPILGIGAGRVALQVQAIDNYSTNQIATSYGTETNIFKHAVLFDAGLGIDFLLRAPKATDEKDYGLVFGLRGGYTQGVGVGNWRYNSGNITENPSYNPGTIYVKANIGFFGRWDRNREMMGGWHK